MAHTAVVATNARFIACLLATAVQLRRAIPNERAIDVLAIAFGAAIATPLASLTGDRPRRACARPWSSFRPSLPMRRCRPPSGSGPA